jgi:probable O-glycosylation ligase (exosortase A-associated)
MIMGVALLRVISVLGSFSRGGFIALIAMSGVLWWRSKRKVFIAGLICVVGMGAVILLPDTFKERMSTITEQFEGRDNRFEEKELDLSFAQRLSVWRMGREMVKQSPITGHGIRAIQQPETAIRFAVPNDPLYGTQWYLARAAHNIYIQVATDSGLVGLGLFLSIFAVAFLNCQWIMRQTRHVAELQEYYHLARLIPVSIVGYMVGGAALSMAYYDGLYMICLIVVCIRRLVLEHQGKVVPRHFVSEKQYRIKRRQEQMLAHERV